MKERDLIRMALWDAVGWQEGLADAHAKDDPWRIEAEKRAKQYRALIKKRYGEAMSVHEAAFDGAEVITLTELRKRHE